MKKLLIVYYSLSCGNTERVARLLQSHTGADLLRIETAVPYPGSYDRIVEQGKEEVLEQTEPAIKPLSLSPESYAAIAVGSPTWWYTMAPAVRTFLHGQNFRGKTVIPFTTNGGWPGHALADMEAACPGAQVACPLQVRFDAEGGDRLETPEADLHTWADAVRALLEDPAQDDKTQDAAFDAANVFGRGTPNTAYAAYFTGDSYLRPLTDPSCPLSVANVTFSPACRNHWHIHHAQTGGGQILLCVAGEGLYQQAGCPAVSLSPGTVITVPPGVSHWHGAKPGCYFSHIALEVPGTGCRTEWGAPVTDEEYQKAGKQA